MRFLTFTFLLLGFTSWGQVFGPPKDLPREYWQELERLEKRAVREEIKEQKQFEKRASDEFDFFIPEVPLPSTEMIAAEGNWGREALEIPQNESEILKRLKGKFCMAIIDTGEPDHKDVAKYKMPGHQSKSYTGEPPLDGHFHATHVAGSQVAKVGDTFIGIAHVAAEAGNLKQAYYKACTNNGGCSYTGIAAAIEDFTSFYLSSLKPEGWGAGINMSLGGSAASQDVARAMKKATEAGIVIFASAGNNARRDISFPAEDPSANAVGAYGKGGEKASFSNWGPEMFANAPGVLVYSTCLGNTECTASGTSMSSPQAAAVYALLKMMMPDKSPQEVLDFMAKYATDAGEPGFDEVYGYGIPKMGRYIEAMGELPPGDPCDKCPPPDCPDCPPEGITPYQYYKVALPGPYKILWVVPETDSEFTPVAYDGPSSIKGQQILTIANLVVEVGVQRSAEEAQKLVETHTKEYFRNRGMLLRRGAGKREAMAYADYFYRTHLQSKLNGSARVLAMDADGLAY